MAESNHESRRQVLTLALAGLATGATSSAHAGEPAAAERRGLYPAGAPAAATGYSPGVAAAGTRVVFVSGQGPDDVQVDMETQLRQTMDHIGLVLAEAGATWEHVVMIRAYFVHLTRDLPVYRKVRLDYLKEPFPASTAVGIAELAIPGLEIEIEAIAIV